ncbi:MAG: ribosome recycling factor [Hyphomicrobiaceae bacterium]
MAAAKFDIKDVERRMRGALDNLKREFSGLRTGRASAALLDPVTVNVYGAKMPLNQLATVSVPDARTISVSVWDKSPLSAVEKGNREASLGLNPDVDGTTNRLPLPASTAERRQELVKLAHKYAEGGKVGVRGVRRDSMDLLKKLEKDHAITEDEHRKNGVKVQELTDKMIKEVDQMLQAKEAEIKQV